MQDSLWHRCLRQLEGEVPEQQFNTWVRPLQPLSGDGVLRLFAPNRFVLDWVQQNLYSRIVDIAARESGGDACQVDRPGSPSAHQPEPRPERGGRRREVQRAARGQPAVAGWFDVERGHRQPVFDAGAREPCCASRRWIRCSRPFSLISVPKSFWKFLTYEMPSIVTSQAFQPCGVARSV